MSGPVRPPLTVAESDGTPTIRPCNTIAFNSADFVVTDNGTAARIDLVPGGGGGASLANTLIGFGDAAGLLTGSANFTFTEETGGSGPALLLQGDSPKFTMKDDTGTAGIIYRTEFVQSGASLFLFGRDSTGTDVEMMRAQPSSVVFNDDGTAMDLRHEASGGAALLWSDAGRSAVGIGTQPASGVKLHILDNESDNDNVVVRIQDSSVDTVGDQVAIEGYWSSAQAGVIYFELRDTSTAASAIVMEASNDAGSLTEFVRIDGNAKAVTFNEQSEDIDFRVETNGDDSTLRIVGSTDNVGISCIPDSDALLHIQDDDGSFATTVRIESTDTDADVGPVLELRRDPAQTAVVNDDLGKLTWIGPGGDGSGTPKDYSQIITEIQGITSGSEHSRLMFKTLVSGTMKEFMRASASGVEINAFSDNIDFKIEGDSTGRINFYSDASNDNIGIGTSSPNSNAVLHITDDGSKANTIRIESTDNDTAVGPVLDIRRNNADGTATDGDNLGVIQFTGLDDNGGAETYCRIRATAPDTHSTLAEGALEFLSLYNATENTMMRIGPIGDGGSDNNAVDINPDAGANVDMRVRGDTVGNLVYVDASSDRVGIGAFPQGSQAQLQVDQDASFLFPHFTDANATVALTDTQCHNGIVFLSYDAAAQAVTLPTAVSGHCVTLVRQQATNAPTVVAASGEKINGVAAPSTVSISAQYGVMVFHGITGTGWVAYEPAVAA